MSHWEIGRLEPTRTAAGFTAKQMRLNMRPKNEADRSSQNTQNTMEGITMTHAFASWVLVKLLLPCPSTYHMDVWQATSLLDSRSRVPCSTKSGHQHASTLRCRSYAWIVVRQLPHEYATVLTTLTDTHASHQKMLTAYFAVGVLIFVLCTLLFQFSPLWSGFEPWHIKLTLQVFIYTYSSRAECFKSKPDWKARMFFKIYRFLYGYIYTYRHTFHSCKTPIYVHCSSKNSSHENSWMALYIYIYVYTYIYIYI